jgi:hypothetical protein
MGEQGHSVIASCNLPGLKASAPRFGECDYEPGWGSSEVQSWEPGLSHLLAMGEGCGPEPCETMPLRGLSPRRKEKVPTMRLNPAIVALALSATALSASMTACATGTVLYDPHRQDYRRWNGVEDRYYRQWEVETHRNHVGFTRRSPGEQQAYRGWRRSPRANGATRPR